MPGGNEHGKSVVERTFGVDYEHSGAYSKQISRGIPVFIYVEVILRALSNSLNYSLHGSFTRWAYLIHLPTYQVNGPRQ